MYRVPRFWRRFQLMANPTVFHVDRRLRVLVRQGKMTDAQARALAAKLVKAA